MPAKLIDFGAATYAAVGSIQQLNENLASYIKDGFLNELKQFEKRGGFTSFSSIGVSAAVDQLYRTKAVTAGTMIAVCNGTFYRINSAGTATAFTGATVTAGNWVSFAEDGYNVFAAAGGRIIRLDLTANTAASMTGGNAPNGVTHVAFLDIYLIANGTSGNAGDTFFSDDRANAYEASDSWEFYNNESVRDTCNAIWVQWNEVYAWGPDSLEVSYDDGQTPFARIDGATLPYGTDAPLSIALVDNTLYYLTNVDGARRVVRMEGRRPVIVSEANDRYLQTISSPGNVRGFALAYNGRSFYALNDITTGRTFVFNLRTRTFSEFTLWTGVIASATLTNNANVTAGDTVVIGDITYTFSSDVTTGEPYQVKRGSSASISFDNLKAAINETGTAGTEYSFGTLQNLLALGSTKTGTTLLVVGRGTGTEFNSVPTTENSSALSWSSTTLTGGTDASANFVGQCSMWWPEQDKFLIGDRRSNGLVHRLTGTNDNGGPIRYELLSNVHKWGTNHKKQTDRLIAQGLGSEVWRLGWSETAAGSYNALYRRFRADGFCYFNRLGRYRSRVYKVIHDQDSAFFLKDAEEWFKVMEH